MCRYGGIEVGSVGALLRGGDDLCQEGQK